METTSKKIYRFSRFSSVRSKCAMDTDLEQFMADICSDTYRRQVEQYRILRLQPGREAEAQRIKSSMPCATVSGICFGGHAITHLQAYSGLLCMDYDHIGNRTDDVITRAAALPYVAAAFRSISGEGVKILVHVREEDLAGGYAPLYAAVGREVSRCVGHAYDEKCAP